MSAVMLGHQLAHKSGVVTDLLTAAQTAGGDAAAEAVQDLKMMRWAAARRAVRAAHNGVVARLTAEAANTPEAAAEAERAATGAW